MLELVRLVDANLGALLIFSIGDAKVEFNNLLKPMEREDWPGCDRLDVVIEAVNAGVGDEVSMLLKACHITGW